MKEIRLNRLSALPIFHRFTSQEEPGVLVIGKSASRDHICTYDEKRLTNHALMNKMGVEREQPFFSYPYANYFWLNHPHLCPLN